MTANEVLSVLIKTDLALSAGVVAVLAVRLAARRWLGAQAAYGLWLLPLAAMAAVLLPPGKVVVAIPPPQIAPVIEPAAVDFAPEAAPVLQLPPTPTPTPMPTIDLKVALALLWALGVVGAAGWFARGQMRFLKLASQGLAGPAAVGVISPRVVVPDDFETRYSRPERAAILAHEAAHIALQHPRTNALAAAIQALHWFNPLVHLAAHLMRIDQELACDAAVVAGRPKLRRLYAETLLKSQLSATPLPLGCYWPERTEHPLTRRVEMLHRPAASRRRRLVGAAGVAVLALAAGLAAWAAQPPGVAVATAATTLGPRSTGISADRISTSPDGKTTTFSGDVVFKAGPMEARTDQLLLINHEAVGAADGSPAWKALGAYLPTLTNVTVDNARSIQVDGRFDFGGQNGTIAVKALGDAAAWRSTLGKGAVMVRFDAENERLKVVTLTSNALGHVQQEKAIYVRSGQRVRLVPRRGVEIVVTASVAAPTEQQKQILRTTLLTAPSTIAAAQSRQMIANLDKGKQDYLRQQPIPPGLFERDLAAPVHLRGMILAYDEINPRARVHLVDYATGKAWAVEIGSANTIRRAGIDKLVSATVTLDGHQAKGQACTPECKAVMREMTFPDGKKIFLGASGVASPLQRALDTGDWRKAAQAGATASQIVRGLQARGQFKTIDPNAAVVSIDAAGKVEVTPMKPLPALGADTAGGRTAGLGGTGFRFGAKPGTITLYPDGATSFGPAGPNGAPAGQWTAPPKPQSEARPDRDIALAQLAALETNFENARRQYEVGLITLSELDRTALALLQADRDASQFTGEHHWTYVPREPSVGRPLIQRTSEVQPITKPPPGWRAFASVYDGNAPVLLKGTVSRTEWINPRVLIHLIDEKGQAWTVEAGSSDAMLVNGLGRDKFSRGAAVTVRGYQAKNKACEPECQAMARGVTLGDGRMITIANR